MLVVTTPRIRKDGKFKIIQISDLHLSTGLGKCRDEEPRGMGMAAGKKGGDGRDSERCEADPRTLEFVGKVLDEEKVDFAVLSGDQVNGETAQDVQSVSFHRVLFLPLSIPAYH
jgi:predicted MPP superfamily phosphohydrolase